MLLVFKILASLLVEVLTILGAVFLCLCGCARVAGDMPAIFKPFFLRAASAPVCQVEWQSLSGT